METHEKILAYFKSLKQLPKSVHMIDRNSKPNMFFDSVGWGENGKVGKLIIGKEEVGIPIRETQEELLKELESAISKYGVLVRK